MGGMSGSRAGLVKVCRNLWRWPNLRHNQSRKADAPGLSVFGAQCLLALAISWLLLSVPSKDETQLDLARVCEQLADPEDQAETADDGDPSIAAGEQASDDDVEEAEEEAASRMMAWMLVSLAPNVAEDSAPGDGQTESEIDLNCANQYGEATWPIAGLSREPTVVDVLGGGLGLSRFLLLEREAKAIAGETSEDKRDFDEDEASWSGIASLDLRGRDLSWTNLTRMILPGAKGDSHTRLHGVILDDAQLQHASLDEVDLEDASMNGVQLTGASLRSAKLSRTALVSANLRNANLANVNLQEAALYGADLTDVSLTRAEMHGAFLDGAELVGATFLQANMDAVSSDRANFYGALLTLTNLADASFAGTSFQTAALCSRACRVRTSTERYLTAR